MRPNPKGGDADVPEVPPSLPSTRGRNTIFILKILAIITLQVLVLVIFRWITGSDATPPPNPITCTPSTVLLIMGQSGSGKLALLSELLGSTEKDVDLFEMNRKGVSIWDWDESEDNLENIKSQIDSVKIILVAIRIDYEAKWEKDMKILKTLQQSIGTCIWKKVVIVLTYANKIEYVKNGIVTRTQDHYELTIKKCTEKIMDFLKKEDVPEESVYSITIIPAGYKNLDLYGQNWKKNLIKKISKLAKTELFHI